MTLSTLEASVCHCYLPYISFLWRFVLVSSSIGVGLPSRPSLHQFSMYDSSRGSPAPRSVSLVVTVLSKLIQATSLTHSIALAMRTHFCLQGFLELIARGSPQKSYPYVQTGPADASYPVVLTHCPCSRWIESMFSVTRCMRDAPTHLHSVQRWAEAPLHRTHNARGS